MESFYHALRINPRACSGCTHCMSLCPTHAIRVREGFAVINGAACVDCGVCLRSCPRQAIVVDQDDFNQIFQYKHRVLLLPTVLFGQFSEEISEEQIFAELHAIGFTYVLEVAQASDILVESMQEYMTANRHSRPFISSFCPAVIRLIQVRFPSLIPHLVHQRQALDLAALYARKRLIDQGADEKEIGVFYVTPCAAKIAAVKNPVGEQQANVDGVINLDFIYNKIQAGLNQHKHQTRDEVPEQCYLSPEAINWSLSEGEACRFEGRCLAIDEIHNVIDILEKIENEEIKDIDFLELRACDHSCAGGPLAINNRFLTIERLRKRMKRSKTTEEKTPNEIQKYKAFLRENIHLTDEILPRSIEKLDENFLVALEKMEKMQRIMEVIPHIDCGVCGTPSCQALALDVVQGKAKLDQCVFMQQMMIKEEALTSKEALELAEKIWGKKRFEKQ